MRQMIGENRVVQVEAVIALESNPALEQHWCRDDTGQFLVPCNLPSIELQDIQLQALKWGEFLIIISIMTLPHLSQNFTQIHHPLPRSSRHVTLAPAVAWTLVLIHHDVAHTDTLQSRCEGQATLAASNDDHLSAVPTRWRYHKMHGTHIFGGSTAYFLLGCLSWGCTIFEFGWVQGTKGCSLTPRATLFSSACLKCSGLQFWVNKNPRHSPNTVCLYKFVPNKNGISTRKYN